MFKKISILFILILILSGVTQTFAAQKFVEFDFGMNLLLMPSDSRMKTTSNFFLISFPVDNKMKVGILNEIATSNGTDGAATIQGNANIQGLRFIREIMSIGRSMSLDAIIGIGSVQITGAGAKNTSMYEIGVRTDISSSRNKVSNVVLSLDALYRIIPYDLAAFGAALPNVSDLGGFSLGVNIGVEF